jgi:hypothetical protein
MGTTSNSAYYDSGVAIISRIAYVTPNFSKKEEIYLARAFFTVISYESFFVAARARSASIPRAQLGRSRARSHIFMSRMSNRH